MKIFHELPLSMLNKAYSITDISSIPNVKIVATVAAGNVYTVRVSNVHLLAY